MSSPRRRLALDILIFDIDGVLIDVSESYRNAIRQSVQLYLEAALRLKSFPGELVSREDVSAFKLAGGFNNDWDLTTGLLKYLLTLVDPLPLPEHALPKTTAESLTYLGTVGARVHTTVEELAQRKDVLSFTRAVAAAGGGLAGVWTVLGERNDYLLLASGDPRQTNLVKRIFEEVYLGDTYFAQEYGQPPLISHGSGLIRRERRIISPGVLEALSARVALGVATGRPRNQAAYALETAGISGFFKALVTHEDIVAAEERAGRGTALGKPHPYTLWEAVRRITPARVRCGYIGDTLDDIRAANAAKTEMDFLSIACLALAEDKPAMRAEFERIGADVIVAGPDELEHLIGIKPQSPFS